MRLLCRYIIYTKNLVPNSCVLLSGLKIFQLVKRNALFCKFELSFWNNPFRGFISHLKSFHLRILLTCQRYCEWISLTIYHFASHRCYICLPHCPIFNHHRTPLFVNLTLLVNNKRYKLWKDYNHKHFLHLSFDNSFHVNLL